MVEYQIRKIQFWVQLQIFSDGDRLIREEEHSFNTNRDEDFFAEEMDENLLEWIKDLKRFGVKEYGWKYLSP